MVKRLGFLVALGLGLASLAGAQGLNLNNFGSSPVFNLTSPSNGQCLVYASGSQTWINSSCSGGGGSGTVTTFSVVSANGFSGTVANPTTTPAATLSTSISGPLKGSSGALAAAAAADISALFGGASGTGTLCLTTNCILTTPNLGTPSAINLTNATSLPATALPALTGDVTSSAGSAATTVVKVNGAAVPTSAAVLSSNALNQITSATTTGSGSIVLGTSPTLTTPNLGTPSAINLTNATAGTVSNTALANSAITFGATSQALGSTVTNLNAVNIGPSTAGTGAFTTLAASTSQTTTATAPCDYWVQSGAGTNLTTWGACVASGVFSLQTDTDALAAGSNILTATRGTTTAVSNVSFGNSTNNPTYSFLGTGAVTAGGVIGGSSVVPTAGGAVPSGTSITQTAGSSLVFNVGGLTAGSFSSPSRNLALSGNLQSGGTKFTASGCSNSTTVGGAWAGSYNSGTTGTCTVVITLPTGATNGYTCWASDTTTPADTQTMTASTTSSATISGTTVSGDVIKFGCLAY